MRQTYDTPAKATIGNTPHVHTATKRPRTCTLPAGTPFDSRRYPRQQREVTSEPGLYSIVPQERLQPNPG